MSERDRTRDVKISGCIPVCNARATLGTALASLRNQSIPVDELIVVDDGSTDGSASAAESAGARTLRHGRNLGRGAARATAVREARGEYILFCDAGMALDPKFAERALGHMNAPETAAVFGWVQSDPQSAAERWRARHLFKSGQPKRLEREALLATSGTLLRREAILDAGNFNVEHRADEDAEMGKRLLAAGWKVVFAPELKVTALARDGFVSVLRRYARWNNAEGRTDWRAYPRLVAYSLRTMVAQDLRARDLPSAVLSLLCPHYQIWRAWRDRPVRAPGKEFASGKLA